MTGMLSMEARVDLPLVGNVFSGTFLDVWLRFGDGEQFIQVLDPWITDPDGNSRNLECPLSEIHNQGPDVLHQPTLFVASDAVARIHYGDESQEEKAFTTEVVKTALEMYAMERLGCDVEVTLVTNSWDGRHDF